MFLYVDVHNSIIETAGEIPVQAPNYKLYRRLA